MLYDIGIKYYGIYCCKIERIHKMCDNNLEEENEDNLLEKRRESFLLLQDITVGYEEKLYHIRLQIKSLNNMIEEKEKEISEIERTKNHNLNLFSPIYNDAYNTNNLISEIDQIQKQIHDLNQEQNNIQIKILQLKTAAKCVDEAIKNHNQSSINKNEENISRPADKGLGILETQEIERQRIARELHDSTVQNLTGLVHKSELCIKLIDIDTIRAKLELNTMSNTLKIIINEMRGIIYNLKPMTLDDLGLTITVQRYANRIISLNNIQVKMTYNEEPTNILPVVKLTVFRVIQEACVNIVKHACATLINIDLKYEDNSINVSIKDNGIGFDVEKSYRNEQSSSFGISIMKERISLLSGTIEIKSEEENGTDVVISVPLEIQEGEKE